jgi:hypothetical protein
MATSKRSVAGTFNSFCVAPSPHVVIESTAEDTPSIPPWFGELTLMIQVMHHRGVLQHIVDQVRLPRGKTGTYEVLDFVLVIIAAILSNEPTLQAFYERVTPFQETLLSLTNRAKLPHRSSLSRFLQDITPECVAQLRRVMEHDLLTFGRSGEALGGLWDHQHDRWVIMDVDATRQVARQRSLTTAPAYPPPRRRKDAVCARGYTGHKRGETMRTRTVVLQAHTQEGLGTWSAAGNGNARQELCQALPVVTRYLKQHNLPLSQGILRMDGLYGKAAVLTHVQQAGLGFVVRCQEYRLLQHAQVRQVVQQTTPQRFRSPDSQTTSEVFDAGEITDWCPASSPDPVRCRLVVMRHAAPSPTEQVKVGKLVKKEQMIYELFVTTLPASALSAREVVSLYHHRGSFEQVLADEDQEQPTDRWFSGHPEGQEFAQILAQMVWNMRGQLGHLTRDPAVRWTQWELEHAEQTRKEDAPQAGSPDLETPSTAGSSADPMAPGGPDCVRDAPTPHAPGLAGPPTAPGEEGSPTLLPDRWLPDTIRHVTTTVQQPTGGPPLKETQAALPADPTPPGGPTTHQTTEEAWSPDVPDQWADPGRGEEMLAPDEPEAAQTDRGLQAVVPRLIRYLVNVLVGMLFLLSLHGATCGRRQADGTTQEGDDSPAEDRTEVGETPASPETSADSPVARDSAGPVGRAASRRVVVSHARSHNRYTGHDFRVQPDGTLRCPADKTLTLQRTRRRPNGIMQVRFAARHKDCRGWGLREHGVPPGTRSPRTVIGTYQDEGETASEPGRQRTEVPAPPEPTTRPVNEETRVPTLRQPPEPVVWKTSTIWWCDDGGRAVRRTFCAHLRRQQVTITQEPGAAAPADRPGPKEGVFTRNQRAHRRLSWHERMQRNARPVTAPRYRIHIPGVSPELVIAMGLNALQE